MGWPVSHLLFSPCLYTSLPQPVSPLLKASAVIQGYPSSVVVPWWYHTKIKVNLNLGCWQDTSIEVSNLLPVSKLSCERQTDRPLDLRPHPALSKLKLTLMSSNVYITLFAFLLSLRILKSITSQSLHLRLPLTHILDQFLFNELQIQFRRSCSLLVQHVYLNIVSGDDFYNSPVLHVS